MSTTPELKPCPFCGNDEVEVHTFVTSVYPTFSKAYRVYRVCCDKCETDGPISKTEKCAAAAWNRRAKQPKENTK